MANVKQSDRLEVLEQFVTDYCMTPRTKADSLRAVMHAAYKVYIADKHLEDYELPINKFYGKMFGREQEILERSGVQIPQETFFDAYVVEDAEGRVTKSELYRSYVDFMNKGGSRGIKSQKWVGLELRKRYAGLSDGRSGQGVRYWTGIRLKDRD